MPTSNRSEVLHRTAVRAAKVGLWDWDVRSNDVVFSAEWKRQLGYEDDEIPNVFGEWENRVHPEDLPRLKELLADYLADPWPDYEAEFRMRHKDGSWRWILAQADLTTDEQGRPAHMVGSHIDLTAHMRARAERERTEELLHKREQEFRAFVENSPDLILRFDREYRETYVNPAVCRAFGLPAEAFLNRPVGTAPRDAGQVTNDPGIAKAHQCIDTVFATGEPIELEVRWPTPGGEKTFGTRYFPEFARDGSVASVLAIARDITARKQAEEALRARTEEFRALTENSPDIISRFDRAGRYLYVNATVEKITGLPVRDLLGQRYGDAFAARSGQPLPEDVSTIRQVIERVFTTGLATEIDGRLPLADGEHLFNVRLIPEFDEAGEVASVLYISRDITEGRRAETALRNVLQHAHILVMHSNVAAPEGWQPNELHWPAASFRWHSHFEDEIAAQKVLPLDVPPGLGYQHGWEKAKHHDDHQPMGVVSVRAFATGATDWQQEFRCIDRHGRLHWFTQTALIERLGHGRWRLTTINTDITDRKLAEEALRASEERFSTVFRLSPTSICIVRASDNRFVDANDAFVKATGYTRDEIIGHTPMELQLWTDPDARAAIVHALEKNGGWETFKLKGRRKSGEIGVGLTSMTRITLNGEFHYLSLIQDITDLERAEEARRASEERLNEAQHLAQIGSWIWLPDGSLIWSETMFQLFAVPREARPTFETFLARVHPAERAVVSTRFNTWIASGRVHTETEYRLLLPDGSTRTITAVGNVERDAAGQVVRAVGTCQDITERRKLEEEFRQSQKMQAVGQLAGGIAHDFNNLLAVIQMQSSLLLGGPVSEEENKEGIQQIMAASERAANLTRQLLTFSRRDVRHTRDLDLGEIAGNMTKLFHRLIGEDISLETRFAPALPLINADPGMMEQVLMNLAVNARDAMLGGGRLIVSLAAVDVDDAYLATHPKAERGRFVRLAVSDTGCGIPPENLSRIFEPFFTTKETGKGTGLGLATVFGIVEQHRGWIDVTSEVGRSTTFQIFLPALAAGSAQSAAAAAPKVRGGHETILLVEDDLTVRKLARITLERYGYRVIVAESAATALERWHARQGTIDLLLTDLVMPGGTTGRELAEQLVVLQPGLKIVYTSGYSSDIVNRQLKLSSGLNFLQKPYPVAELAATVRRCLDEG